MVRRSWPFETWCLRSETPFSDTQKGYDALNDNATCYPAIFAPDWSARPDFKKVWERRASLQTGAWNLRHLPMNQCPGDLQVWREREHCICHRFPIPQDERINVYRERSPDLGVGARCRASSSVLSPGRAWTTTCWSPIIRDSMFLEIAYCLFLHDEYPLLSWQWGAKTVTRHIYLSLPPPGK